MKLLNCPVCDNVPLEEIERGNVMIDVCSNCKGIWLDRGELEKIIQGLQDDKAEILRSNRSNGKRYDSTETNKKPTMLEVLSDVLFFW